jgi:hypothetical protein
MNPHLVRAFALLLVAIPVACVPPIDVHTVSLPDADFAHYVTFRVEKTETAPPQYSTSRASMEVRDRVAQMATGILTAKGYVVASESEADMTLRVAVGRRDLDVPPQPQGRGPFVGQQYIIDEVLVIDVFDDRTQKPIWQATSRADIDQNRINVTQLQRAVGAVFEGFPARAAAGPSVPLSL